MQSYRIVAEAAVLGSTEHPGHSGTQLNPIVTRYIWPSELDLMARIAGLRLKERWAGWSREPLTPTSSNCISVYGR